MGTSMGRKAPTGKFWRLAKATISRFSSPQNRGRVSVAEVAACYAQALEESPSEAGPGREPFPHIRQVAQDLGRFFQTLARQGLAEALIELGLEQQIGRPPLTWLPALVDTLAGPGAVLEAAVARSALIDVLSGELVASSESYASWRDRWPGASAPATITAHLRSFLAEAVFQKLAADLGEAVEAQAGDTPNGAQRLEELRNFIKEQIFLTPAATEPFDLSWTASQRQAWIDGQLQQLLGRLAADHGG